MKFFLHVKITLKIPFNNTFMDITFCLRNLEVGRPGLNILLYYIICFDPFYVI